MPNRRLMGMVAAAALFVVACVAADWLLAPPPGVRAAAVRRVAPGATLAEVESLLGGPPDSTHSLSSLKQCHLAGDAPPPSSPPSPPPGAGLWSADWTGPQGHALVCFDSGRAYVAFFTDGAGHETTYLGNDSWRTRFATGCGRMRKALGW